MATVLKPIGTADLAAVVRIMNESSAGHSFQFELDLMKYLLLSRFWNFSYESSYLAWTDSQPGGIVLNCVDRDAGEAYSFYWGVLPEFRKRRLSMELAFKYLAEAKRQGLRRTYADSSSDSPLEIYLKLGYREHHREVELRTSVMPDADTAAKVERLEMAEVLSQVQLFPPAMYSWIARPSFLQSAAPFLEVFGVRQGERLSAWMVLSRWTGNTTIVALGFHPDAEHAARQLVSHVATYPSPYTASQIVMGSPADRLLRDCGFAPFAERVSVALDLETYSPRR